MTIDEVIAHAREKAKEQRSHIGTWDDEYSKRCEKYAEEHEQIAEWLEELKSLKENSISKEAFEKMKSRAYKKGHRQGYKKAIDDFAEKLNAKCDGMIKEEWNSNVAPISWAEAYADFKDDIDEIAEKLKEGGENEM